MSLKPITQPAAIFPTAIGECGLAWNEQGLSRVWLPLGKKETLKKHLRQNFFTIIEEKSWPSLITQTIARLQKFLSGQQPQGDLLEDIPCDLSWASPFSQRVYEAARLIKPGQTISYGALAARVGCPQAARAVGAAMARNRLPLIIPCHRVIAADGRLTGFSAPGGIKTKRQLLQIDRAIAK